MVSAGSLNNSNVSNPIASPIGTTTYTVTVTNANGCSNTSSTSITVNALPVVSVSSNKAICIGSATQLTCSGGTSFTWSPSTGLSNPNIFNPTANPSSLVTYTVTATNANGCSANATVSISVNSLPVVTASPDVAVCSGGSVQISASGGVNYNWSPSGSLNNSAVYNPVASPAGTTTYTVTATDVNGCSNTASTMVTINSLPVVSISPNASVCTGSGAQLSASGGTSYTWLPSGSLNNANVSNPVASPINTITYTVTVTNANGCSNIATTTITVNATLIVTASPNTAICIGSATQLTSSGGISFSWTPSTGLGDPNISNPTANPSAATTYTLISSDINGCSGSASVTVSVNPLPVVSLSQNNSVCTGSSIQLTSSGGSLYSWSPSTGLSNAFISNPLASPTATTNYTLNVTDVNGCSAGGAVTVTANPLPTVSVSPGTSICLGLNAQLTSSGGTSYSWTPSTGLNNPGISNPTANPTSTTVYSVIVTDLNSCSNSGTTTITVNPLPVVNVSSNAAICIGSNAQLSSSGGVSYSWTPSSGLSNAAISNPVANPTSTTSYSVTITDANSCSNTGTALVTVNPLPVVSVNPPVAICHGSSAQLSASGGTGYVWSPSTGLNNSTIANPVSAQSSTVSYTVTVTDVNNCVSSGSTTVTVNPFATVNVSPNSAICNGNNTLLTASGGVTYTWSPANGLSNTGIANPVAHPSSTTAYSISVTDANGCQDTASLTITVNNPPALVPSVTNVSCFGKADGSAMVSASGSSPFIYLWSTGATTQNVAPLDTGIYSVTVTDKYGCVSDDTLTITEPPPIILNFQRDYYICDESGGVTLNASGGTSYLWSPGADLDDSTSANPFASPAVTTVYTVTVSNGACFDTAHVTVHLVSAPALPNITQNGDTLSCLSVIPATSGILTDHLFPVQQLIFMLQSMMACTAFIFLTLSDAEDLLKVSMSSLQEYHCLLSFQE